MVSVPFKPLLLHNLSAKKTVPDVVEVIKCLEIYRVNVNGSLKGIAPWVVLSAINPLIPATSNPAVGKPLVRHRLWSKPAPLLVVDTLLIPRFNALATAASNVSLFTTAIKTSYRYNLYVEFIVRVE